jgi:hypothetical protein
MQSVLTTWVSISLLGSDPTRASKFLGTTQSSSVFGAGPSLGSGNQTSKTLPWASLVAKP